MNDSEVPINCEQVELLLPERVMPSFCGPAEDWQAVSQRLQGWATCRDRCQAVRQIVLLLWTSIDARIRHSDEAEVIRRAYQSQVARRRLRESD